jgi:hypothetical protein
MGNGVTAVNYSQKMAGQLGLKTMLQIFKTMLAE